MQGVLYQSEVSGRSWILLAVEHNLGLDARYQVDAAITQIRNGGIPWAQILSTLLPLILSLFSGGSPGLAALLQALLALLNPTPPA